MEILIWIQTTVGFVHIVGRNIEQEKVAKPTKLFDTTEGNCAIDVTISTFKERNANLHFMIQRNYKFTKENIPENYHLSVDTVVPDIFQKQH